MMVGIGIVGYLVPYDAVMAMFGRGSNDVGEIDGESIDYATWQTAIDKQQTLFNYNTNDQSLSNDTWNALIEERLYTASFSDLNLEVSDNELDEVLFGEILSPFVKNTIYGGQDSASYKERMRSRFDTFDPNDPTWTPEKAGAWKEYVRYKRKKEKFDNMVKFGMYSNTLDAKWAFRAQNSRAVVEFVAKPFNEIPDSTIQVTEDEVKDFYNKHKAEREYKQERSRSVEYISIEVAASQADSLDILKKLEALKADFRASKSDSAFAETSASVPGQGKIRYKIGGYGEPLNSQILSDSIGKVIGPVRDGDSFKLVKISKRGTEVDSVQARHILIKDSSPKGKALADSIKKVIEAKKNFAELAAKYGTDGTKDKGGDLGMFGRGAMVKEFETACFGGKLGVIQVISTQFGWHVVEVTKKKAPSPATYIAVVDRKIEPSANTKKAAYSRIMGMTTECRDTASFRAVADTLLGGTVKLVKAQYIVPGSKSVAGLNEAEDLVRWAYGAEINDVSQPFPIDKYWVVAVLTEVRERGVPSFENAFDMMKAKVIKEKKGQMLKERMTGSSLQDIAGKNNTQVRRSENLTLRNVNIPEAGIGEQEFALIGHVFGAAKDNVSEPIVGEGGVYVVKRIGDVIQASSVDNFATDKKGLNASGKMGASQRMYAAFREAADIDDRRFVQQ